MIDGRRGRSEVPAVDPAEEHVRPLRGDRWRAPLQHHKRSHSASDAAWSPSA